jgi:hypothetical protein
MLSPWDRRNFAVAGRVAVLLVLFASFLLPTQQKVEKDVHVLALIHPHDSKPLDAVVEQLAGDIGTGTSLTTSVVGDNVETAVQDALWAIDPAAQGAIILASDGDWNPALEPTLRQAKAGLIPIFWLPLKTLETTPNVAGVRAPTRARGGQSIGVGVDIRLEKQEPIEAVLLANNRPVARSVADRSGVVGFPVEVPETGPLILGAELRDANTGEVVARLRQAALVNVVVPPSFLVVSSYPSLFAESLRKGNWQVREISPGEMGGQLENLGSISGLILDDVAISELPDSAWSEIGDAVSNEAMGLLVLGGPHAFGLGGYRESRLESILPVISEPPGEDDVSGSMDNANSSGRRLQITRQAVVETARALRPVDRVGLMTFDVDARELMPLVSRPDHVKTIEEVWPERASGGTQVAPALRSATETLQRHEQQKLLVLLTDGFLADGDMDQIEETLRRSDVALIAMVIDNGGQVDMGRISRIAHASGGRAVRVDDVLRLPVLMRSEIESYRPALVTGPFRPAESVSSSFIPAGLNWPAVDAYLLTRPRDEAQVHLVSERGDVLVASMKVGAGRVMAITSGLSYWASGWLRWNEWPEIAAKLTRFIAARGASDIDITLQRTKNGQAQLTVSLAQRRLPEPVPSATLISPIVDFRGPSTEKSW